MEMATIQAAKRQGLGTHAAKRLRKEGLVPAVLYGHQRDTLHLTVPLKEIERAIVAGTRMVALEIGGTTETALLKDIQHDRMGDHLLHVDLARVAMDEKVTLTVPVELHGHAKGVLSGGSLEHMVQDIEVSCLPGDIPEKIRVEIAGLDVGQMLHVSDLTAPPGVEFELDGGTPVVAVHAPVAEKEAAPAVEEAVTPPEPEVIRRRAAEDADEDKE